jgi:Ala-tRNA(Pro) deacylase
MPATPNDLFVILDKLDIATETRTHAPMFTVEESRALRGNMPGLHSKNLFLKDKKGALFLVVAHESTRIDLKRIHETMNASGRVSFGSADLLHDVLGVEPGSVTPFAVLNDTAGKVSVVLDINLLMGPALNFHPLINTMTTSLEAEDLLRFLRATGHPPRILELPAPEALTPEAATGA